VKVIILAAGQGTRMGVISESTPKSLLPIGETNIICRLIKQLLDRDITDILIVLGFKEDLLREAIAKEVGENVVTFVVNKNYKEDINILSLSLALKCIDTQKFIIFEADCVYDDPAMDRIIESTFDDKSYWYTIGKFQETQQGGILLADKSCSVVDLEIVPYFDKTYLKYNKLIGILKVGKAESERFIELVKNFSKITIRQYYLKPWIDHLEELPCSEISLKEFKTGAFNDLEEYNKVLSSF